MSRIKKANLILALVVSMIGMGTKLVDASENKLNFTPQVKQSPQKMDDSQTDFKLKGKQGEEVSLELSVKNESDKPIRLKTQIKDAATNNQGIVNYTSNQQVLNKKLSLAQLADYQDSFELKGKEVKNIKVDIPLPQDKFSGILLGGLLIEQEPDKEAKAMIKNAFSYSLPIVVIESEKNIEANLTFNSIKPELNNGRNTLKISLDNPVNNLLSEAKYSVEVTPKANSTVLYQDDIKEMSFAPNNTFNHYVDMGKDAYKPGEYKAHIKVTSPYGDWEWQEDFEIKASKAKELNKDSVSINRMSNTTKWLIILVVLLVLLLLILIYILLKKMKKEEKTKDE